ncbi:MAG: FAD-dependent monooxygenase [Gammaproteobacteria bacterium]|nr:FAD-dependent monooxygenase [Gammaproteobacteria bacterium]
MKILISGAGIAGLTAAYWLNQYGFEVDIVDKFRGGQNRFGYAIDLRAAGLSILKKMNLHEKLRDKSFVLDDIFFINAAGLEEALFPISKYKDLFENYSYSCLRGDLETVLSEALPSDSPIQFGLTVDELIDDANKVIVRFSNNTKKEYDMVIAADGIHSRVRQLVFGDENPFLHYTGYQLCAMIQPNTVALKNALYLFSIPEKQVIVCPIKNNQLAVYFVYQHDKKECDHPKQKLCDAFSDAQWIIPKVLENMPKASEILFDHLSQVKMPSWHQGQVVLIGDAAHCLTLAAGQGASMAMVGAYLLATALREHKNNVQAAFKNYEIRMKPEIEKKQIEASDFLNTLTSNQASLDRHFMIRQFLKSMQKSVDL